MPGELLEDHVVVRAQSEASRIHSKGHFGRPLSGGALRLDLLEAAYLAETGRLSVERAGEGLAWADLVVEGSRAVSGFEILYLVYRDLRERGYLLKAAPDADLRDGAHFLLWPRGTERPGPAKVWMRAVSERSPLRLAELQRFVEGARKTHCDARICLVDEESDLTYYELTDDPPKGPIPSQALKQPRDALLLADRVLVADAEAAERLHGDEFFGKPVARGLQLSLVEATYLAERGDLRLLDAATRKPLSQSQLRKRGRDIEPHLELRLRVYRDLKGRGLIVKTGFKFGTHFRAYEGRPEESHAPYLVQAVPHDFESPWEPVARAIRLSHSVRKRFYLAGVRGHEVGFLAFGRYRP